MLKHLQFNIKKHFLILANRMISTLTLKWPFNCFDYQVQDYKCFNLK